MVQTVEIVEWIMHAGRPSKYATFFKMRHAKRSQNVPI